MTLDQLDAAERAYHAPEARYDAEPPRYRLFGGGIAWRYLGRETRPDADTDWTGIEAETGRALFVMIGDDRPEAHDPADAEPIDPLSYCAECGQIGCCHDGRERP
jgi:hypothetical protein